MRRKKPEDAERLQVNCSLLLCFNNGGGVNKY